MSVAVYLLPMLGGAPIRQSREDGLQSTFKQDLQGYDIRSSRMVRFNFGPYICMYDLALAMTEVRPNESWERLVRPTNKPVPIIRGPVVVMCRPNTLMNWARFAELVGDFFEQQMQAAMHRLQLEGAGEGEAAATLQNLSKDVTPIKEL